MFHRIHPDLVFPAFRQDNTKMAHQSRLNIPSRGQPASAAQKLSNSEDVEDPKRIRAQIFANIAKIGQNKENSWDEEQMSIFDAARSCHISLADVQKLRDEAKTRADESKKLVLGLVAKAAANPSELQLQEALARHLPLAAADQSTRVAIANLRKYNGELRTRVEKLDAELLAKSEELRTVNEKLAAAHTTLSAIQSLAFQQLAEKLPAELKSNFDQILSTINESSTNTEKLLREREQTTNELRDKLNAANQERTSLISAACQLEKDKKGLNSKLGYAESQLKSVVGERDALGRNFGQSLLALKDLKVKKEQTVKERDRLRGKNSQLSSNIEDLQADQVRLRGVKEKLRSHFAVLRADYDMLVSERNDLLTANDIVSSQLSSSQTLYNDVILERNRLLTDND